MGCGENSWDCPPVHILPVLIGHAVKKDEQWAAHCPSCNAPAKCLSIRLGTLGRRLVWLCHGSAACSEQEIHAAMLARGIDPACIPLRTAPKLSSLRPDVEACLAILASDLPPTALKVALAREFGLSAAEARRVLKIKKATYYDAMRELGAGS